MVENLLDRAPGVAVRIGSEFGLNKVRAGVIGVDNASKLVIQYNS